MGRNGKRPAAFTAIINFINDNVGKVITSREVLFGKEPGRNSETSYLYIFVKLGYLEPTEGSYVNDKNANFKVLKKFPPHYNSVSLKRELKEFNGLIPDERKRII